MGWKVVGHPATEKISPGQGQDLCFNELAFTWLQYPPPSSQLLLPGKITAPVKMRSRNVRLQTYMTPLTAGFRESTPSILFWQVPLYWSIIYFQANWKSSKTATLQYFHVKDHLLSRSFSPQKKSKTSHPFAPKKKLGRTPPQPRKLF